MVLTLRDKANNGAARHAFGMALSDWVEQNWWERAATDDVIAENFATKHQDVVLLFQPPDRANVF